MIFWIGWVVGIITAAVFTLAWAFSVELKRLGRKLFRRVWKAKCAKCGTEYRGHSKGFWLPRRIWLARHRARCHGDHEDIDKPFGRPQAPKPNPKYLQP